MRGAPRQVAPADQRSRQIRRRRPVAPRLLAHVFLVYLQQRHEVAEPAEISHGVVGNAPQHVERVVALHDRQARGAFQCVVGGDEAAKRLG